MLTKRLAKQSIAFSIESEVVYQWCEGTLPREGYKWGKRNLTITGGEIIDHKSNCRPLSCAITLSDATRKKKEEKAARGEERDRCFLCYTVHSSISACLIE